MTAMRNTILALGLTLLTLAAGLARAADANLGGAADIQANATASNQEAGAACCQEGSGAVMGLSPNDFCHDPGCRYSGQPGCLEADPIFSEFAPQFQDLCERCAGCCWRFDASALYMHRPDPTPTTLLTDNGTGATLLNAVNMDFPWKVGPRFAFIVTDCEGLGLELNYFNIDGWSSTRNFTSADFSAGVANLIVDGAGNQEQVTNANSDITSMLESSEINLRQHLFGNNNLDGLIGFRWIDMNDLYTAQGASNTVTGSTVMESIRTHNHLFGLQSGLDGTIFSRGEYFQLRGYIKGGCMLDNANAATSLSGGALGSLAASDSLCHISCFGEAGLTGYIEIDKHVSISFGYQAMYISNAAQPVNQMSQTNLVAGTTLIDLGSSLAYQGVNLGMEVAW